ncbi:MAG: hypothetical protein LAC69_02465 [Chlorobium sp.]|jgi:putative component of toxin-antitoxin plasmid stabilization module|nr:hypothetical protein [Chlorobium sp.]
MQDEWELDLSLASGSAFSKFQKNHGREYVSCFNNLNKIIGLLKDGHPLIKLNRNPGFFVSEGKGVYRIGQTGVVGAKETRLYVYPSEQDMVIYVLGIGTKESQKSDINEAHKAVRVLKK